MGDFALYFRLGLEHITDWAAYDHMLFLVALIAGYSWFRWRAIALIVTAFTIGHSITLALSVLGILQFPSNMIEFAIPLTIFLTAAYTLISLRSTGTGNLAIHYPMGVIFGFIHGMGFSNYLRSLLGKEESILWPLLSFNLGLEAGQLLFVALLLFLSTLIVKYSPLRFKDWATVLSLISMLLSLYLMYQTKFW